MKQLIADQLASITPLSADDIVGLLSKPQRIEHGEFSFPCFTLAKSLKQSPVQISQQLAEQFSLPSYSAEAVGPYLNFKVNRDAAVVDQLKQLIDNADALATADIGKGDVVCLDFSSPNIAKPLAFHHIRSTMIGNALANIYRAAGYKVERINHLGDWGTQFGYIIAAFCDLSDEEIAKLSLAQVVEQYVAMNKKAKEDPAVEAAAREWFLKLEQKDAKGQLIWQRCRDLSIEEFKRVYAILGVDFDSFSGEAFFVDQLNNVFEKAESAGILSVSEGATVVDLEDVGINTPCLLRKQDGATLYATRDLAAAMYRQDTYGFAKCIYVTDMGQSLHFKQFFAVLKKLGFAWADELTHVPFGVLLNWDEGSQEWAKGRTRDGGVVLLEDVLNESMKRAQSIIEEKNPDLENKDAVAQAVGVGAVVFNDLKNKRNRDVKFKFEDVLNFEGETGPYLQYTCARAGSIVRKFGKAVQVPSDVSALVDDDSFNLLKQLTSMSDAITKAADENEPSYIASYALDLAALFNTYVSKFRFLGEAETDQRVILAHGVHHMIKRALALLGVKAPEQM